jgi:hypothetical protein
MAADFVALKALQAGTATPEQQQRALKWLIENACGTYDLSYRPESDRETAFAEGRRFVGLQIIKALNFDMAVLRNNHENS